MILGAFKIPPSQILGFKLCCLGESLGGVLGCRVSDRESGLSVQVAYKMRLRICRV